MWTGITDPLLAQCTADGEMPFLYKCESGTETGLCRDSNGSSGALKQPKAVNGHLFLTDFGVKSAPVNQPIFFLNISLENTT